MVHSDIRALWDFRYQELQRLHLADRYRYKGPMSIQQQLDDALKTAMRQKQSETVACIRQLKSKVQEAINQPQFKGPVDDALYQQIITSYAKSLEKGISEFTAAGARGENLVAQYKREIAYLSQYLPKLLDQDEVEALVHKTLEQMGVTDPKQAGRVLGALIKAHPNRIDPKMAKACIDRALEKTSAP